MRVLVTGGAGYVGTSVIAHLVEAGHRVMCLDPRADELQGLLRLPMADRAVAISTGSVLDTAHVASLAQDCDGVIHLAAVVGAPACAKDPEEAWNLNVEGTRSVIAAMRPAQPLVMASTCSVYGHVRSSICTEQDPTRPLTVYGETKVAAERLVTESGGAVVRFVTLYGDAPRFRWDLLLHTFLRLASSNQPLELFDPEAYRPMLHVRDAARSLVFCLDKFPELSGSTFNVGSSDSTLTKRELAESIARHMPFEIRIDATQSDPDQRDYKISCDLIRLKGYQAEVELVDSLPSLIAFVKHNMPRDLVR